MMIEQIDNLINKARKEDSPSLLVYTLIKSELLNNIHSKKPTSEFEVLHRMIKEREKSEDMYLKNSRRDLAKNELDEIQIIKQLLPAEPPTETIYTTIKNAIAVLNKKPTMQDSPYIINTVVTKFPSTQKSTIIRIFKTFI